jgi:hypothetical protein
MSGHYWEAMLWAQGKFSSSGNKKIYGTLGAGEATLSSDITGSFEVWFKSNNASIGALGQTVLIRYWREAKGNAGDVFP